MDRELLEQLALLRCDPECFYELSDYISETPDSLLMSILNYYGED